MKDCTFELEFTSHVLANGGQGGNEDKFQRDSDNHIVFQQPWFHSAFTAGISLARIKGVKASDIQVDLTFSAPTETFSRKYGEHNNFRRHEAIMPGTKVKFEAVVADHITEKTLRDVLTKVGKFVGLSPYGFKLGYGKFNVVDVHVGPSDAAI